MSGEADISSGATSAGGSRPPSSSATSSPSRAQQGPMILRIKRKRGTEAPDALFVQKHFAQLDAAAAEHSGSGDASDEKNKRRSSVRLPASPSTDALPVFGKGAEGEKRSPLARSSSSPTGFFRLAETVSFESVSNGRSSEVELRRRVAKLQLLRRQQQQEPSEDAVPATDTSQAGSAPHTSAQDVPKRLQMTGRAASSSLASKQHRDSPLKRTSSSTSLRAKAERIRDEKARQAKARKPGIVPGAASAAFARVAQGLPARPRQAQSRIIDIVVDGSNASKASASPAKAKTTRQKEKQRKQDDEVDSLGNIFRSMLVDHLKGRSGSRSSSLPPLSCSTCGLLLACSQKRTLAG